MEHETPKAKKSKTEKPSCSWIDLPKDVTANILHRLGAVEILNNAQRVCTTWLNVCKDPSMWRIIDMKNNGWSEEDYKGVDEDDYDARGLEKLVSMCYRAIDLSQGQCFDINMEYFGTKHLLSYLTERSPQLRRLSIAACFCIKGKCLVETIVKFPMLEELHLFGMRTLVSAGNVKSIGRLCPMLKSFTYDHKAIGDRILSDGLAFAVAKSMPNLLHLRLFGNKLTNKGLQSILDGCPLLESLDLRKCKNVVLEGDLEKRCSQTIRSLKRPSDAADDEWVHCPDSENYDMEESRNICDLYEYQQHNRDMYCFDDALPSDSDSDYCGPDMC